MTGKAIRMRPPRVFTATVFASLALVVAGCGGYVTPTPATARPTATGPSSPSGSAAAEASACATDAIRAQSDGWGGAAGSRGADVVVTNAGEAACSLPPRPAIAIFDNQGQVVLQSRPEPGGEPPTLDPGGTATFSFLVSNWCDQSATLPFHVTVVMADGPVGISGVPIESLDDLPPCNGPGEPASASATDWTPG
jgi:hypothetical protein